MLAGRHGLIWLLLLSVCNTVRIDRECTARGVTIVTNGRGEYTSGFWLAPRAHRRDAGRSISVLFAHQVLMGLRGGGDTASRSKLSDDDGWDNFAAPASSMRAGPLQMTWGMATEEETVTKAELHNELKEYREDRKEEQQRTNKGRLEKVSMVKIDSRIL